MSDGATPLPVYFNIFLSKPHHLMATINFMEKIIPLFITDFMTKRNSKSPSSLIIIIMITSPLSSWCHCTIYNIYVLTILYVFSHVIKHQDSEGPWEMLKTWLCKAFFLSSNSASHSWHMRRFGLFEADSPLQICVTGSLEENLSW